MPTGKMILRNVAVVVNNVVFTGHAFNVDTPQTKEQIDVSGFGSPEVLPGQSNSQLVVQFLQDFGTAAAGGVVPVHNTLYPLYATDGTTFPVYIQPLASEGTSATNPIYGGTASLFDYNGLSGALNARAELTATFLPAGGQDFTWGTAAI